MAKTRREIKERINLIDIVYEVIDARMPKSSKIIDLDYILKDKPRILIVTKYDLCDKTVTDKFIKDYEKKYPVIKVDLKKNDKNVSKKTRIVYNFGFFVKNASKPLNLGVLTMWTSPLLYESFCRIFAYLLTL